MKVVIETNFSFSKLVSEYKDIRKDMVQESIQDEAQKMKERVSTATTITGSPMKPIKDSTVLMRGIRNHSMNTPPLNASGKLLKSIKAIKSGISINSYGIYQNDGYTPKKIPIGLSRQAVKKSKAKRGVFFRNNTKNIKVPAREFIHNEATYGIDKKVLAKYLRSIHLALKIPKSVVLS